MRKIEDNILKIANEYEVNLGNLGFDDNESADEIKDLFRDIIKDYKKMIRKCERDGIEIDDDIKEFEVVLEDGSCEEQYGAISNVKDKIVNLMDLCGDDVPEKMEEKYRQDLFDLMKS